MRQSTTLRLSLVACTVAAAVGSVTLFADDKKPATPPAQMDPAAMQAMMEKAGALGPEHAELAKEVGTWECEIEDLTPGMNAPKEKGTSTSKLIMGGRVLQEDFKGTMMGQPFEGMALSGYDNIRKQYWTTWMDSMSTGMMVSYGTRTADKLVMDGTFTCPMSPEPATAKSTITYESPDKHVMEMSMAMKDGTPMGAMRITYLRKK